ncbi:MAG: gliding motility-associated C-terminal domain-containing protein [Cyclobacteriaceae bacterium]|nr:gliding motility-associated C-terminal domain-containing protein [Cyclobacteriaceae bacterium]
MRQELKISIPQLKMIKMKLFLLSLFIIPALTFGQGFFISNSATVNVTNGSILVVKESLVNNGTLTNNGSLVMGGVWLNTGTYNPGEGRITFNSTSDEQIINHNAQAFSWLTIEGGGVKKFLADIVVERELILTNGIMVAENNSKIIFDETAVITGGSDQSHVQGAVQHSGTGTKLFPLGNGSVYLPIQVNGITSNAQIVASTTELGSSNLLKSSSLNGISDQRYFTVTVASGSLQNATVTLPVRDENSLGNNVQSFVVAEASALNDPFVSLSQSNVTGSASTGSVTSAQSPSRTLLAVASADNSGIVVFNAIAPTGFDLNRYMRIANLPFPNKVSIFNRWGDRVFEMENYDDTVSGKRFSGTDINGNELPTGNYFYKIEVDNKEVKTGYLSLKR